MTTKKMKKSSESSPSNLPPPPSFSSLPYDLALNILARISLIHRSTLSIVSKSFQSLLASRELYATRSLIGKTEDCLYVCLDLNMENHKLPRWFTLAPTPNQHKLIPIPLFNYDHPKYSTVVSIGSKIYIIGGYFKVVVLDCQSHQWSRLPDMIVPRERPAAEVIDGKIYVIGGCDDEHDNIEDWGEVYDPKTQIWEPLSTTTLDNLVTQMSMVPGRLVMGGKVYDKDGLKLNLKKSICLVEIDKNVFCQIAIVFCSSLYWRDQKEDLAWSKVMGLEELPHNTSYFVLIANSCRGRRLTIWWKNSKIWCAEISFERRSFNELWV